MVGAWEENLEMHERKNSWEPRIERATGAKAEETKMTPTLVVCEPGIMEVALTGRKTVKGWDENKIKICFVHVEFEGTK